MATILVKIVRWSGAEPLGSRGWFYGEDVFRFLRKMPWGEVDIGDVDKMGTQLAITGVKRDNSRRLMRWLEGEAERHQLTVEFEED